MSVLCLLPLKSYAEEEGIKEENAPIKITSSRMETQNGKNVVSFMENVVAKKGDMTIYANRLDVYSDKNKKKLIKIIAEGDVRIEKGLKTATGATAEYYDEEQKLILRGNPKLKEKDNLIEGSEIIYYIKEENVTVHGDEKKKVEVTLFPEEKK
ncbi:MAG: lipopolysaccharide transport periplasmic protein LptA [Nitrospinae bacterium]|nr:lipopolysaccharide transport periplasmic protein LptA [Nitrospinota bacterium]